METERRWNTVEDSVARLAASQLEEQLSIDTLLAEDVAVELAAMIVARLRRDGMQLPVESK